MRKTLLRLPSPRALAFEHQRLHELTYAYTHPSSPSALLPTQPTRCTAQLLRFALTPAQHGRWYLVPAPNVVLLASRYRRERSQEHNAVL